MEGSTVWFFEKNITKGESYVKKRISPKEKMLKKAGRDRGL